MIDGSCDFYVTVVHERGFVLGCPLRTVFSKCRRAESLKVSFHL